MRKTVLGIILTLFCVGTVQGQQEISEMLNEAGQRGVELAEKWNEEYEEKQANTSIAICASVFVLISITLIGLYVWSKRKKAEAKMRARLRARHVNLEVQLREKHTQLCAEYSKVFEERKIAIGIIKCTQCGWTGQWGTGLSYEQFFAGNLAEAGIQVSDRNIYNDNLSRDNRQYTCPVCNSDKWEKV